MIVTGWGKKSIIQNSFTKTYLLIFLPIIVYLPNIICLHFLIGLSLFMEQVICWYIILFVVVLKWFYKRKMYLIGKYLLIFLNLQVLRNFKSSTLLFDFIGYDFWCARACVVVSCWSFVELIASVDTMAFVAKNNFDW